MERGTPHGSTLTRPFDPLPALSIPVASGALFDQHHQSITGLYRVLITAHRRFAMSLDLNSGTCAGDTLRFPEFVTDSHKPAAGGCAIFCCDLLHALPVTAGQCDALFIDAEGAQQERKLMANAAARGQKGDELR